MGGEMMSQIAFGCATLALLVGLLERAEGAHEWMSWSAEDESSSGEEFGGKKSQHEQQQQHQRQPEGSWSHWWSYDGISGPDYWNINKRWQLCTAGKKQSPVEIQTSLLVYDHLLAPIQLTWLTQLKPSQPDRWQMGDGERATSESKPTQPIRTYLHNSGRGLELWMERPAGRGGRDAATPPEEPAARLVVSAGPLSYEYALYKLELHSASRPGAPTGDQWGRTGEHPIDGRAFVAELQLHFYNLQLAQSGAQALAMASQTANLFAAVSVYLAPAESAGGRAPNGSQAALELVADRLESLGKVGDSLELELSADQLEALVPERHQYVTYEGSMNRPPCAENVQWLLLNRALKVDGRRLANLFERPDGGQDNVRPTSALNRRILRTTISTQATPAKTSEQQQLEPNDKQELRPALSSNCSQPIGRPEEPQKQQQQQQQCNMRPNYSYQLRAWPGERGAGWRPARQLAQPPDKLH